MRYFTLVFCLWLAPVLADAKSIEEHILVSYRHVVNELQERGFEGPMAEEVGRFALIRQLIEDGQNRDHSVSIVGMCPGGANERAMCDLGLTLGATNEDGITLKKITSNGETFYALHGPRSDVYSVVAVTLLWDRYVNEAQTHCFKNEEIHAWNVSKEISRRIGAGAATDQELDRYFGDLAVPRRKAIEKANRLYSSTAAAAITKIVNDMKEIFDFVRF